jgi:hypothetical protein
VASFSNQFTAANLAASIPEIWTPIVLEQMFASTVASNFFLDLSEYATEGGSTFDIANLYTNTFSVQTQSTQGAQVTLADPAQVKVQLAINTHNYVAALAGDKDIAQLQKSFNFNVEYANQMRKTTMNALEVSLFGLWSSLSTNLITNSAAAFTDQEARQAIANIEAQNLDDTEFGNLAFFLHPNVFWNQAAAITKYYQAYSLNSRDNSSVVESGTINGKPHSNGLRGEIYNIPIYVSTNVVDNLGGYRNLLAHKNAFGFGIQTPGGSKVRVQSEYLLENLGLLIVTDIIFGTIVVRDPFGVVITVSDTATVS